MCVRARACAHACAHVAGFPPVDRVMDLFIVACGLCVMYEIHLKFSVLNEALTCLHMGKCGLKGKWIIVNLLFFVVFLAAKWS